MTSSTFQITRLDHVQLAMPQGGQDRAEAFYAGLLGFTRVPKPAPLAVRGGCWFEKGGVHRTRPDDELPGVRRCHIEDPFGNRIELVAVAE